MNVIGGNKRKTSNYSLKALVMVLRTGTDGRRYLPSLPGIFSTWERSPNSSNLRGADVVVEHARLPA